MLESVLFGKISQVADVKEPSHEVMEMPFIDCLLCANYMFFPCVLIKDDEFGDTRRCQNLDVVHYQNF